MNVKGNDSYFVILKKNWNQMFPGILKWWP